MAGLACRLCACGVCAALCSPRPKRTGRAHRSPGASPCSPALTAPALSLSRVVFGRLPAGVRPVMHPANGRSVLLGLPLPPPPGYLHAIAPAALHPLALASSDPARGAPPNILLLLTRDDALDDLAVAAHEPHAARLGLKNLAHRRLDSATTKGTHTQHPHEHAPKERNRRHRRTRPRLRCGVLRCVRLGPQRRHRFAPRLGFQAPPRRHL